MKMLTIHFRLYGIQRFGSMTSVYNVPLLVPCASRSNSSGKGRKRDIAGGVILCENSICNSLTFGVWFLEVAFVFVGIFLGFGILEPRIMCEDFGEFPVLNAMVLRE